MAQGVMQKHSQWLQDFRKQVAAVAGSTQRQGTDGVGGRQYEHLAEGSSKQTSAEVLLPMHPSLPTPRSSQPLTLDLGGQQLVISLVPKSV